MENRHRWEGDRVPEGLLRLVRRARAGRRALARPRAAPWNRRNHPAFPLGRPLNIALEWAYTREELEELLADPR